MEKFDKSLMEVWDWKEKVYQETKDLSDKEYIEKLQSDTDKILKEAGIALEPYVSPLERVEESK